MGHNFHTPSLHPEALFWSTRRLEVHECGVHCNNGDTTTLETIGEMFFFLIQIHIEKLII